MNENKTAEQGALTSKEEFNIKGELCHYLFPELDEEAQSNRYRPVTKGIFSKKYEVPAISLS